MKRLWITSLFLLFAVTASATLPVTRPFDGVTGTIPTADETAWAYNRAVGNTNTFSVSNSTTNHITIGDRTTDTAMHWTGDTFNADQYSEVTLATAATTAAGTGFGPAVRCDTGTTQKTMYRLVVSTQGYELTKFVNAATTSLSTALTTTTFADGDVVRLTIIGSTLSMKKNGLEFGITYNDTALTTGAPGVGHSSTTNLLAANGIDTWTGGNAGRPPMSPILFN